MGRHDKDMRVEKRRDPMNACRSCSPAITTSPSRSRTSSPGHRRRGQAPRFARRGVGIRPAGNAPAYTAGGTPEPAGPPGDAPGHLRTAFLFSTSSAVMMGTPTAGGSRTSAGSRSLREKRSPRATPSSGSTAALASTPTASSATGAEQGRPNAETSPVGGLRRKDARSLDDHR